MIPIARNPNGRGFWRWDQDETAQQRVQKERRFQQLLRGDFDISGDEDDDDDDEDGGAGQRKRRRFVKKPHKAVTSASKRRLDLEQVDLMIRRFLTDKSMQRYMVAVPPPSQYRSRSHYARV